MTKRLSIEVGCYSRDPEREEVWQTVSSSKRNTADMLKEYSAGVLIKGYRAYLRGDYVDVDTRRFEQFMERGKKKQLPAVAEAEVKAGGQAVGRLRRMESRYQWALTIRENVSYFFLSMTGLQGNCRLRKSASRPAARSRGQRAAGSSHRTNAEALTV